jgi:CheY-like chemotaxis protein
VALAFLTKMGLLVDIAGNGREAVERVAGADYDAVLMDIQMPVMDGYRATTIIRESERGKALPVIAMTAAAMPRDRMATEAAGMNGFVAKPIDPVQLIDTLLQFIHPRQQSPPMLSSSKITASDFDLARTMGDLETLLTILKKNRAIPDDLISGLHSQLAGHPASHLVKALIRQTHIFDFDSARVTVEKIINEVQM